MKKVLFVIPTMRMGGAEQSLVSLLSGLDYQKYDVDLLLFEKGGELLGRIPRQVNVIAADTVTRGMTLEFRYFFKDLIREKHFLAAAARLFMLANSKLESLCKRHLLFNWHIAKHFIKPLKKRYDVAVGYLEGTTDFYVADKVLADRKIAWIHTDFARVKRDYQAEGRYYNRFDNIAIISDACRDSFIDHYPQLAEVTQVVENISDRRIVINKSLEPVEAGFKGEETCIVTVGRLEYVKGIDLALEAAVILKNAGVSFVWHVFGNGTLRESLEKRIQEMHLHDCFRLEGTTENPYKYMRAADVIVQSSRYEGKSIVLDEAKILGKPIVVTNYPSAKDQIVGGETGLIVDLNGEALAEGIRILLQDPELRDRLAQNCAGAADNAAEQLRKINALLGE